jgi:plasmid stabilization system protein ParE
LAALIYSERALADLERLADFLLDTDPAAAPETIGLIEVDVWDAADAWPEIVDRESAWQT